MLAVHSNPVGELGTQDTGGMSVYVRELARELGRLGHQVDIFTRRRDSREKATVDLFAHVRLIHLQAGSNGDVHKLALYPHLDEFCNELERFRLREGIHYDLIHSHYWLSGLVGNWARDRWGVPHLILFHTLGALKNRTVEPEREPELRISAEKQLVECCDRILASTKREKNDLVHFYGADPEDIAVVPCGVNLDLFRPLDKSKAREQLGLDPQGPLVLFVGRFAPLKGIERLLASMTCLRHHRRLRLVIVGGNGYDRPESVNLVRLSEELGIRDSVVFQGRIEHAKLPPFYSAADVLVVPSYYESFGLVALESLACGTPVVATRVGAMPDILRDGETGCVVPDGSPRSLAQGIDSVLNGCRARSADAIRASVLKYGWAHIASAIVDEYRDVLRRACAPTGSFSSTKEDVETSHAAYASGTRKDGSRLSTG